MRTALIKSLRAALGGRDTDAAMRAAFAVARQAGLDDPVCDTPEEARALMRRMALAGHADLAFGRLFEGHVNAVQLIRAHGTAEQGAVLNSGLANGAILGVWNSDQPGNGLTFDGTRLTGAKNFASGAGIVTDALVTVEANDPARTRMVLVKLGPGVPIDRRWWRPIGMERSETHIVDLSGLTVRSDMIIGAPGAYQAQPAFGAGALRFVAVQAGGIHALFDAVRGHLVEKDRAGNPHQKHRLARLFGLADTAYALLDRTVRVWGTDEPDRLLALVAAARGTIETLAMEAIAIAEAAVGVQGLLAPHPLARIVTDLSVYLRQPNPDGARDHAGDAAAAGLIVPGEDA